MTPDEQTAAVLIPDEGEAWLAFVKRIRAVHHRRLVILSGRERELLDHPDFLEQVLAACRTQPRHTFVATAHRALLAELRERGLSVIQHTRQLKQALGPDHPKLALAIQAFSPHIWRQQLKSQLQSMGLLSLPRLRSYGLVLLSLALFSFVVFRLLPSAELTIHPRQDSVGETSNLFLVASGAMLPPGSAPGVTRLELEPVVVTIEKTITFDQISKQFRGTAATLEMSVVNQTENDIELRKGTRFMNQAGMIFTIPQRLKVPGRSQKNVTATAAAEDLYGQIIGDRGNVPADLQWTIPGLNEADQKLIFGQNRTAGTGGTTAYATVLTEQDLKLAQSRLEQELEAAAKGEVEWRRSERDARTLANSFRLLTPTKLFKKEFQHLSLPTQLVGQETNSLTASGTLVYTVLGYDLEPILELLRGRLTEHVREGKKLREDLLDAEHLDVRVILYDDNLTWAKVTAELTGTEEFILDPLTPAGALFAQRVRESITDTSKAEALRIVQNMPEVDHAEISIWPFWNSTLPSIPSHITITPE